MQIKFRSRSKRLKAIPNIEEKLIEEYLDGAGVLTLAKKYNSGQEGSIKNVLVNNGIRLRNVKEARNAKICAENYSRSRTKIKDPKDIEYIIEQYNAGISPTRIGQEYNVSHITINKLLQRNGITLRTRKEAANLNTTKNLKEESNLKKYGVRNPMQNKNIFNRAMKSGYRFKRHIIGDVQFCNLQGYEPECINFLVEKENIKPEDIHAGRSDVPTVEYIKNSKSHFYFPDIYIPKYNLLIEVKSDYIFNRRRSTNLLKQQASKDAGYNHHIMIFDDRGKYLQTIK